MEFLNNFDGFTLVLLTCCLCGFGFVVLFALQVVGGALEIVFEVFGMFFDFLGAGPVAWCGCLLVLLGCGGCAAITMAIIGLLSTCDTPDAVNFCRLF